MIKQWLGSIFNFDILVLQIVVAIKLGISKGSRWDKGKFTLGPMLRFIFLSFLLPKMGFVIESLSHC